MFWKYSVFLILLWSTITAPSHASVEAGFDEVVLEVEKQSGVPEDQVIVDAYQIMVRRLSGSSLPLANPTMQLNQQAIEQLIISLRYIVRDGKTLLKLRFNQAQIERNLASAGESVWTGKRPTIRLWLLEAGDKDIENDDYQLLVPTPASTDTDLVDATALIVDGSTGLKTIQLTGAATNETEFLANEGSDLSSAKSERIKRIENAMKSPNDSVVDSSPDDQKQVERPKSLIDELKKQFDFYGFNVSFPTEDDLANVALNNSELLTNQPTVHAYDTVNDAEVTLLGTVILNREMSDEAMLATAAILNPNTVDTTEGNNNSSETNNTSETNIANNEELSALIEVAMIEKGLVEPISINYRGSDLNELAQRTVEAVSAMLSERYAINYEVVSSTDQRQMTVSIQGVSTLAHMVQVLDFLEAQLVVEDVKLVSISNDVLKVDLQMATQWFDAKTSIISSGLLTDTELNDVLQYTPSKNADVLGSNDE